MEESFIEFYGKHKISPVSQDISDLERHYKRRNSLYRHLGFLPSYFKGKKILEAGPGSGYNSIHIASLEPFLYHLVEGNSTGVEHVNNLFSKFSIRKDNITVFKQLIEDFKSSETYDIVICEGMLSGLVNPENTLSILKKHVSKDGVLIITTVDPISYLAETLRNLTGKLLVSQCNTLEEKIQLLLPVFTPHLSTLKGMNRRYDDWIVDNIINPAAIGRLLSIPDAIHVLESEFEIYGASPNIFTDWRWYKSIGILDGTINSIIVEQYWKMAHNFIDHSKLFKNRKVEQNKKLFEMCLKLRCHIRQIKDESNRLLLEDIVTILREIINDVNQFSREVGAALSEICDLIVPYELNAEKMKKCKRFATLFGRGQQYLSFTKV